MITDVQVSRALERMPIEMMALFETMPEDFQRAYLAYWEGRPDPHGAHRDTLPAFVAGVFTGLRR
jgi:hypothetical protein